MATPRNRSISSKVTEAEYQQVAQLAGQQTISAWARSIILTAMDQDPMHVTVIAELIAMRRTVISLLFAIAKNDTITEHMVHRAIEDGDRDKLARAYELLDATKSSKPIRRTS